MGTKEDGIDLSKLTDKDALEYAKLGLEAIEEAIEARQKEEEELYKKYKCRRWLIVPDLLYEELMENDSIKKRDIEDGSCSAYIRTSEDFGVYKWVRIYKRKELSKLTTK